MAAVSSLFPLDAAAVGRHLFYCRTDLSSSLSGVCAVNFYALV